MTPWRVEALLREAAARATGVESARIPFVWPRRAPRDGDYASALALRLASAAGRPAARVAAGIAGELRAVPELRAVTVEGRGFLNLTAVPATRAELVLAASDGPRYLTGRAWRGDGEWRASPLHEAGPVSQARRLARSDARHRMAQALGEAPPAGPAAGEVSWRDPYLDGGADDPLTPAARLLHTIGEAATRIACCRSVPERPRADETTGRDLPALPSAERPGAWVRLTPENPAFAVRYAHAHAVSTVRWAAEPSGPSEPSGASEPSGSSGAWEAAPGAVADVPVGGAADALLGALFDGPGMLAAATSREEPHILVRYLEGLAGAYDEWRVSPHAAASRPGGQGAAARLALCTAVAEVLRTGLFLLGVAAPTRL